MSMPIQIDNGGGSTIAITTSTTFVPFLSGLPVQDGVDLDAYFGAHEDCSLSSQCTGVGGGIFTADPVIVDGFYLAA